MKSICKIILEAFIGSSICLGGFMWICILFGTVDGKYIFQDANGMIGVMILLIVGKAWFSVMRGAINDL